MDLDGLAKINRGDQQSQLHEKYDGSKMIPYHSKMNIIEEMKYFLLLTITTLSFYPIVVLCQSDRVSPKPSK